MYIHERNDWPRFHWKWSSLRSLWPPFVTGKGT